MKSMGTKHSSLESNPWANHFNCDMCFFKLDKCAILDIAGEKSDRYSVCKISDINDKCPFHRNRESIKDEQCVIKKAKQLVDNTHVDFCIVLCINENTTCDTIKKCLEKIADIGKIKPYIHCIIKDESQFTTIQQLLRTFSLANDSWKYSLTCMVDTDDFIREALSNARATWEIFVDPNKDFDYNVLKTLNHNFLYKWWRNLLLYKNKELHGLCLHSSAEKLLDFQKNNLTQIKEVIDDGFARKY